MAESVEQELRKKYESAIKDLDEVNGYIKRYNNKREILEERINDLRKALRAFEIT